MGFIFLLGGNVLSVDVIVRLVVEFGRLVNCVVFVVLCFIFTCPLSRFDVCSNNSASSLQKSVLHKHAKIEPEPSSVISLCEQSGNGTSGS